MLVPAQDDGIGLRHRARRVKTVLLAREQAIGEHDGARGQGPLEGVLRTAYPHVEHDGPSAACFHDIFQAADPRIP